MLLKTTHHLLAKAQYCVCTHGRVRVHTAVPDCNTKFTKCSTKFSRYSTAVDLNLDLPGPGMHVSTFHPSWDASGYPV